MAEIDVDTMGIYGGEIEDDTDAHTGKNFFGFKVIEEAVFSVLTTNVTINATLGDITWPAGYVFLGNVTAYTLASGVVQFFNKHPGF